MHLDLPKPKILFQDHHYMAISKPTGLYSWTTGNPKNITVGQVFPQYLLTHRLDADTSGVLLLAKTPRAASEMAHQFEKRTVEKTYMAISATPCEKEHFEKWQDFLIKGRKGRMKVSSDNGLTAVTEVHLIPLKLGSLLILKPKTGRTHQLRVQSQFHGYPILGDKIYGKKYPYKRLMLHAASLSFFHPIERKEVLVKDNLPEEFRKFLRNGSPPSRG